MSRDKRLPIADHVLGMGRNITRRDFVNGVGLSSLGMIFPAWGSGPRTTADYPPTRTGLRGSHPGSFETAHALAREGMTFSSARDTGEFYDLVVIGGGISGLASVWYYRRLFGADSRILVVENHDDFGGHAKRNEFHHDGVMRLAWGGVFNLEYPAFSPTVNALMTELGVDIDRLLAGLEFNYGRNGRLGPSTWFDAETYGRDVLIPGFAIRNANLAGNAEKVDQMPLDAASRASLKAFYSARENVLENHSSAERARYLRQISYLDFIQEHGGLTPQAASIFLRSTDGYWGVSADALSVAECVGADLPVQHLLGGEPEIVDERINDVAMFPDGNASIARLLVRKMIPAVAPGNSMDDIVTAKFDYSQLDQSESRVRIRLNSTAVAVRQDADRVAVDYVNGGQTLRVNSRHCVLACWHSVIPYLCPALPAEQKEAMKYQVKRPLVLTNVLLRNADAFERLGINGAYCPGRLHQNVWLVHGIEVGDYRHAWNDDGAVVVMFWGMPHSPNRQLPIREQHRAARTRMLSMEFADFEREVRTVLNGMLGSAGFSAAEDILAVTVNRWPHGYAYDYLDLWDPEWPPGEAPHEIARRPFGNIAIANADAGADAYTHVAIDQAWRAVNELRNMPA